jgi:hypothetical protein
MRIGITVWLMLALVLLPLASGIGVSPSKISAENMLREGHFEKQVYLSGIPSGEKVSVQVEGNIKDWITTDEGDSFYFPKGQASVPLTFMIDVPGDAANGIYEATAEISSGKESKNKGETSVSVISKVKVEITVKITGTQVREYTISSVSIPATEDGSPINVFVTIQNKGNVAAGPERMDFVVREKPEGEIIWQGNISEIKGIMPYTTGISEITFQTGLPKGQYWAYAAFYDADKLIQKQDSVLDIFEKGSLKKSGALNSVACDRIKLGETAKIVGVFENTGETAVSAKLVAEIYKDGGLTSVTESPYSEVLPGKTDSLIIYYRPFAAGDYTIKAYAPYSVKKTAMIDALLKVTDNSASMPSGNMIKQIPPGTLKAGTVCIAALLAAILLLAVRRHRQYKNKIQK